MAKLIPKREEKQESQTADPVRYIIDGRILDVRSRPTSVGSFVSPRMWDKTQRHALEPDVKHKFVKSATGYVLTKHNKLQVLSTKTEDDGVLQHVHNLQTQLKLLRAHADDYDISDVFTIVVPLSLTTTPLLNTTADNKPETYDLFTDYTILHPTTVANSNAWYNTWAENEYVSENMTYTFTMLQNNTDEKLWMKCIEDLETYSPIQQGGPLMLYLILKRIQNVSESAIEHLKIKISKVSIKKIPGENVDNVVSLIKSTHNVLISASTADRNYIPDDFPCQILRVFQTSSVKAFNAAFKFEEQKVLHKADRLGGTPEWPTITELTNLATNMYQRMLSENTWHIQKPAPAALPATDGNVQRQRGSNRRPAKPKCFNCGEEHLLPACPHPRNEDKIAKARQEFNADKRKRFGSNSKPNNTNSGSRTQYDTKGRALTVNKKGDMVVDQRKLQASRELQALNAVVKELDDAASQPASTPAPSSQSSGTDSTPPAGFLSAKREQAAKACAKLQELVPKL